MFLVRCFAGWARSTGKYFKALRCNCQSAYHHTIQNVRSKLWSVYYTFGFVVLGVVLISRVGMPDICLNVPFFRT